MSRLVTEFDDEQTNRWYMLEIEFDYEPPTRQYVFGSLCIDLSGQLILHSVEVLEIKAHNDDGDVVLSGVREGFNDVFDPAACDLVENEIDHWGSLADELVKEVT